MLSFGQGGKPVRLTHRALEQDILLHPNYVQDSKNLQTETMKKDGSEPTPID